MTDLAIAIAPAPLRPGFDSDVSHEVCCTDEEIDVGRIAMCGLPLSGGDIEEGVPDCLVCLDLLEQWALNADLYGEDPQHPGDEPCRVCPRRHSEAPRA